MAQPRSCLARRLICSPIDIEYRYLTQQHGWVLWQYYHNGKLTQWSNHNKVVQGTVTPDFPCFAIP